METATLNLGSGRDTWGDIRIDMTRSQTGVLNKPNLVASALFVPLRAMTVREVRCRHVIEHIKDWKSVMAEIARVSDIGCRVEFRFPIDDGYKRDFLVSWSRADFSGMFHAYSTRKTRAHAWVMNPRLVSSLLGSLGFTVDCKRNARGLFFPYWAFLPRWSKLLPRMLRDPRTTKRIEALTALFPKLDYEWVVRAVRTR